MAKISGTLHLNPKLRTVTGHIILEYAQSDLQETMVFILPFGLSKIEITSDNIKNYRIFTPDDPFPMVCSNRYVEIELKDSEKCSSLHLEFTYEADMTALPEELANVFTEEYIELGLYAPYFPLYKEFKCHSFHVELYIPEDYVLVGNYIHKYDNHYKLISEVDYYGYPIIASKHFACKEVNYNGKSFRLYWIENLNDQFTSLAEDMLTVFQFYVDKFGSLKTFSGLDVFISPRDNRSGGYNRPGLIILPCLGEDVSHVHWKYGDDPYEYAFKYLAHEIAHSWWCQGEMNTWNNWLNESFAEYSSLLATKSIIGEERFRELTKLYCERSRDKDPVMNCEATHDDYFDIMYIKGTFILHTLHERLGDQVFFELCKHIYDANVSTTDHLLRIISSHSDCNVSKDLLELLKS